MVNTAKVPFVSEEAIDEEIDEEMNKEDDEEDRGGNSGPF